MSLWLIVQSEPQFYYHHYPYQYHPVRPVHYPNPNIQYVPAESRSSQDVNVSELKPMSKLITLSPYFYR